MFAGMGHSVARLKSWTPWRVESAPSFPLTRDTMKLTLDQMRQPEMMQGRVTWAGFTSREYGADLSSGEDGTVIAAAFDIPREVGIDRWHEIVLNHRGDAVFTRGGQRYLVRDAIVQKYTVARLIIVSLNSLEYLD